MIVMEPVVLSWVISMPNICLTGPKSWVSNFELRSDLTCDIRVLEDARMVILSTYIATITIPSLCQGHVEWEQSDLE